MNSALTASKPATVTLDDGTMLPSDSVMSSEQITAAIEAFELSAGDLR